MGNYIQLGRGVRIDKLQVTLIPTKGYEKCRELYRKQAPKSQVTITRDMLCGGDEEHSHIHTGSKPYQCTQCDKGFSNRGSLWVHVKQHEVDKPYACSECHKTFSHSSHLSVHKRLHTGEKPYRYDNNQTSPGIWNFYFGSWPLD